CEISIAKARKSQQTWRESGFSLQTGDWLRISGTRCPKARRLRPGNSLPVTGLPSSGFSLKPDERRRPTTGDFVFATRRGSYGRAAQADSGDIGSNGQAVRQRIGSDAGIESRPAG